MTCPVSGIPDLVKDDENGLLVPDRNPEKLADALQRLIEDADLRSRLGTQARQTIVGGFDIRSTTGSLAQIFRSYHDQDRQPSSG